MGHTLLGVLIALAILVWGLYYLIALPPWMEGRSLLQCFKGRVALFWHSRSARRFALISFASLILVAGMSVQFEWADAPYILPIQLVTVLNVAIHWMQPGSVVVLGVSQREAGGEIAHIVCGSVRPIRVTSLLRKESLKETLGEGDEMSNLRTLDGSDWRKQLEIALDSAVLVVIDVRVASEHVSHELDHVARSASRPYNLILVGDEDSNAPAIDNWISDDDLLKNLPNVVPITRLEQIVQALKKKLEVTWNHRHPFHYWLSILFVALLETPLLLTWLAQSQLTTMSKNEVGARFGQLKPVADCGFDPSSALLIERLFGSGDGIAVAGDDESRRIMHFTGKVLDGLAVKVADDRDFGFDQGPAKPPFTNIISEFGLSTNWTPQRVKAGYSHMLWVSEYCHEARYDPDLHLLVIVSRIFSATNERKHPLLGAKLEVNSGH